MNSQSTRFSRSKTRQNASFRSLLESLESRCMLSGSADQTIVVPLTIVSAQASSGSVAGYSPAQIRSAYGITGDGSGQTIAIVDAYSDPNIASDLATFDQQFGLSAPASFTQVSATGSTKLPAANAGWDTEISLDVEWAHAIASKASIVLVDAASDSLSSLMTAVNYARNLSSVSVISMSWGASEFSGETSYDSYFTTPAGHTGITFVAASGDQGASGGALWPAVSSNVLSVGGTTLTLSSSGSIASETAWSDSSGGTSRYESLSVQSSATGLQGRSSPDVSFDANPNTGLAVYDSVAYEGYVGWQEVGGTSAGAPSWAGIIAIADTDRGSAGTLTTAQTLTDVYSIYSNASSYSSDFNDITSGTSILGYAVGGGGFGRFGGFRRQITVVYESAATGYDTLTGVGTPDSGLIGALASNTTASAQSLASTKITSSVRTSGSLMRHAVVFSDDPIATPAVDLETGSRQTFQSRLQSETNLPVASVSLLTHAPNALHQVWKTVYSALPVAADSIHSIFNLETLSTMIGEMQPAQPFAQSVNLSNGQATASITSLASIGLHSAEMQMPQALIAAAPKLADHKQEWAAIGLGLVAADIAVMVYSYRSRGRKHANGSASLFNGGQKIE